MTTELGPSSWYQADTETLLDVDGCMILRRGNRRHLVPTGQWTDEHTQLAYKYKVNSVALQEASFKGRKTAEFLLDLPPLRELHIVVAEPRDLSAVGRLTRLEYLGITGILVSPRHDPPPVDCSGLKKLKKAMIRLCPPVRSVLNCEILEELTIWGLTVTEPNRDWAKKQHVELDLSQLPALTTLKLRACTDIRDVDLTQQPALRELGLEAIPKLRSVKLHPQARVLKMKMGGCGPYRIDWERMGPHLEDLELIGPLRFSVEDVLKAPNLHTFRTNGVRTFPPLKFLLKLRHLRTLEVFTTPPGPKFSEEDWAVYRTINHRDKERPT